MIRFVILNGFIVIHTIIFCLLAILVSFFAKSSRSIRFYVSMPWAKIILWICGIKVRVKGQENVCDGVPTVFMCNHQSYFDIFGLLAFLPADFNFILKQELMNIPIFGYALKRAGHIAINRENRREAVRSMDKVAKTIKSGKSALIFPEGTRSKDGKLQPLRKGGFHMALKSGCDIVPIAIRNSHRIVVKGSRKINRGCFSVHFGKPIPTGGYERKDIPLLVARVREAILELMESESENLGTI